jgi:ubiquinone/menaquinone biosynthesis C-methylase UbiE
MELNDAIGLIRNSYLTANASHPAVWADLGCGTGLFSHALGALLAPGSAIYAVDKRNRLKPEVTAREIRIIPMQADFERDVLDLNNLDGILMANSLHYVQDKPAFLEKLRGYTKDAADFLMVEYDTDKSVSHWVPYPVSFDALERLFQEAGYRSVHKLSERPSMFGRSNLYAAYIVK